MTSFHLLPSSTKSRWMIKKFQKYLYLVIEWPLLYLDSFLSTKKSKWLLFYWYCLKNERFWYYNWIWRICSFLGKVSCTDEEKPVIQWALNLLWKDEGFSQPVNGVAAQTYFSDMFLPEVKRELPSKFFH